jgi:hypothetical protein
LAAADAGAVPRGAVVAFRVFRVREPTDCGGPPTGGKSEWPGDGPPAGAKALDCDGAAAAALNASRRQGRGSRGPARSFRDT